MEGGPCRGGGGGHVMERETTPRGQLTNARKEHFGLCECPAIGIGSVVGLLCAPIPADLAPFECHGLDGVFLCVFVLNHLGDVFLELVFFFALDDCIELGVLFRQLSRNGARHAVNPLLGKPVGHNQIGSKYAQGPILQQCSYQTAGGIG